jgi:hypothetical protein
LALDSPTKDPNSTLKLSLFWIDLTTSVIFLLESIGKQIAFGLIANGKWSYLRSSWNILDFIIIIFTLFL